MLYYTLVAGRKWVTEARLSCHAHPYIPHFHFLYSRDLFASSSGLGTTPLTATAAMPGSSMRIYRGEPVDNRVAEEVRIGDPLTLVVTIDAQDIYGMHISDCSVKDGLGWSEQALINEDG